MENDTTTFERRLAIIEELFRGGMVTASYLAKKYNVHISTINRDISKLSRRFPICTTKGRNGGVSIMEGYKHGTLYLDDKQKDTISMIIDKHRKKIPIILEDSDAEELEKMLHKFSLPNENENKSRKHEG